MSERVLPEGWALASIDQVSHKGEQRKPDAAEQFIYVDIGSIDRESKVIASPQRLSGSDAPSRARKVVRAGDILVSLTRPNLNAVALVGKEYDGQIASTGFEVIRPVGIDSRLLFSLVRSTSFVDAISGKVQGALYPAAKSADVKAFQFSLPPLVEQKAIADKLDELLAQVSNLKARLDAIPAILKRFRQSVLAAAVSGGLTEGWRMDRVVPFPYPRKILDDLILEMRNGLSPKPNEDANGDPILRISSVRPFSVDQHDIRFLEVGEKEKERYSLLVGDLVFTRYNGSAEFVGVCGRIDKLHHETLLYPDKLIRVRVDGEKVASKYLELFSASFPARNYVQSLIKSTSGQKGISGKDLKEMVIALPCLDEQIEIVRRVDQLFAFANQVERQVANAQARVDKLTQSILAKAFRGELTAEWRAANAELISGENSAEALLDMIKAEKAEQKPVGKGRGRKPR